MVENIWVIQNWNYGLGNFINLTPTIKLMADHFGEPIPVYFDLDFIRQCFIDCPFMKILDKKPDNKSLFGSWLINPRNDVPDYVNVYREVCKSLPLGTELPHTYVDRAEEIDLPSGQYTLFIRGSGTELTDYVQSKTPDNKYYTERMKGMCIFTGSDNDLARANGMFDHMTQHMGNIRLSLALIREANLVVANDSGLAHAAGAMNKNMDLLWKDTSRPKNENPGVNTKYISCL